MNPTLQRVANMEMRREANQDYDCCWILSAIYIAQLVLLSPHVAWLHGFESASQLAYHCLSVCLCVCLSDCMSFFLTDCLSDSVCVCVSVCLSVCLSVGLSIYLSGACYLPATGAAEGG